MFKKLIICLLVLSLSVVLGGLAFATQPLSTDTANTVGQKSAQIELGYSYTNDTPKIKNINTVVTYGILPSLDLIVEIPYTRIDAATVTNGFGDVTVKAKWNLVKGKAGAISIEPIATLPTGDDTKGLGTGKTEYGAAVLITTEILSPVVLHGNMSYMRNSNSYDLTKDLWKESVAAEIAIVKDLKLVAEVGMYNKIDNDKNKLFYGGGAIYTIVKGVAVDVGLSKAPMTTGGVLLDYVASAGLTFNF